MDGRLLILLCLSSRFFFIQVEGQSVIADINDVDDKSTSLDESPVTRTEPSFGAVDASIFADESLVSEAEGSESALVEGDVKEILASSEAHESVEAPASELAEPQASQSFEGPTQESSRRFENSIGRAISQCRRETDLPSCFWRNRHAVISEGLVVEEEIKRNLCCCACHRADECQAAHYMERDGVCVFHQGPIRRDRRQGATKRWRK